LFQMHNNSVPQTDYFVMFFSYLEIKFNLLTW
jgi:hypothetical protein